LKTVALVSAFIALAAALQVLARRWRIPHPVLLVIGGAAIAFIPGLPTLTIDPDTLFVIFVPPLLYYGTAFRGSIRDFRNELWPIIRLGVLLVLATIGVVAVAAHAMTPAFTWPAAFALAAIVSPPDPVAASAVMRPLRAPSRLVSILEGEGLVNDATALVAYRIAVAAAVTGRFSASTAFVELLAAGAGGIALGLATGWLIARIQRNCVGLPVVENTISLLTPFAAYLPADALGASGILAVVATGLYVGWVGPAVVRPAARVQAEATWSMVAFILEGLVFMFVGLELPGVLHGLKSQSHTLLFWHAAEVSALLIALRMVWVFPSAYIPQLLVRRLRGPHRRIDQPRTWQAVFIVGWAGIRGADSLVIALALPLVTAAGTPFPARDLIIFITFAVIFVTLVVQGLTLRPLLHLLRVRGDHHDETEEAHARRVGAEAGLRKLDELSSKDGVHKETAGLLRTLHQKRARNWAARDRAQHGTDDEEHRALEFISVEAVEKESSTYRYLRLSMIDAERHTLIELRDQAVIGDDVLRRIQRDLDLETMTLDAANEGPQASPYEGT
jgi:CPA1 family monovalent cation:H+ antiporter